MGFVVHRVDQPLQFGQQAQGEGMQRHLAAGGVHIVGGLAAVDVVVGVDQRIIALFAAQDLDGAVGDDLVGVHIGAGARAALDGIDDELIVQPARDDLIARLLDGAGHLLPDGAGGQVGARAGLFDPGDADDHIPLQALAGDGKVFRRADGMDAVVNILGNVHFPDDIVLNPERLAHGWPPLSHIANCC